MYNSAASSIVTELYIHHHDVLGGERDAEEIMYKMSSIGNCWHSVILDLYPGLADFFL